MGREMGRLHFCPIEPRKQRAVGDQRGRCRRAPPPAGPFRKIWRGGAHPHTHPGRPSWREQQPRLPRAATCPSSEASPIEPSGCPRAGRTLLPGSPGGVFLPLRQEAALLAGLARLHARPQQVRARGSLRASRARRCAPAPRGRPRSQLPLISPPLAARPQSAPPCAKGAGRGGERSSARPAAKRASGAVSWGLLEAEEAPPPRAKPSCPCALQALSGRVPGKRVQPSGPEVSPPVVRYPCTRAHSHAHEG